MSSQTPNEQENEYPANCIRGISDSCLIGADGTVGSGLFQFDETHLRPDGWIEESINWEDDEHAVQFTLDQTKDGELQFRVGVAKIPRIRIDDYNQLPAVNGVLSYERKPEECNRYHGNILLRGNLEKPTKRRVVGGLANYVSVIIKRH